MKVIGFDPILTAEAAARAGIELVGLDEIFRRSDFITVHAPLTDETRGIVGAAAFAKMKQGRAHHQLRARRHCRRGRAARGAELRATSRAPRLTSSSRNRRRPDHPLIHHANVVAVPHLGAATDEAQVQVAVDIAQQVADFLIEGTIRHAVNIPALSVQELEVLGPHLTLGEKLGRLSAQLIGEAPNQLTVGFRGRSRRPQRRTDHRRGAEGAAERISRSGIEFRQRARSSRAIAASRLPRPARAKPPTIVNILTITVRTPTSTHEVTGAVFGNRALRLIRIDGYRVEAAPEGYFLMLHNRDVPGVVGAIGTMLGRGRDQYRGPQTRARPRRRHRAQPVRGRRPGSGRMLERLKTIPAITAASQIKL